MKKQLILKNRLCEIERIVTSVEGFGKKHCLTHSLIYDVTLVLEEIFSNIVYYSYEDEDEHHINICLHLKNDEVILEVRNDGKPFNPLEAPMPDISLPFGNRDEGGLGILLICRIMDTLEYRLEQGQNVLLMKKPATYAASKTH